jgi:hypothetical protein
MKNKKGSTGVVIAVVLGVIILVGVIVLIFVLNERGAFKPKTEDVIKIPLFIMPRDEATKQPVESNYILEYKNSKGEREILSQGKLDDSYNELQVPRDSIIQFDCWSDQYYLVKAFKKHTPEEITNNKSIFSCDMDKIGNLTITHSGNFKTSASIINLNLTTNNNYYKTSFCFAWSSGVLDVSLKDQFTVCEKGAWKNWTKYDAEKKKFTYLDNDTYLCGDYNELDESQNRYEVCAFAEGTKCKVETEEVPKRFKGNVDSCVYSGKTLKNGTYTFDLEVRTLDMKNILDKIEIYVYDKERIYDPTMQDWIWKSEDQGKDIGAPDYTYTIEYDGGGCLGDVCTI